MWGPFVHRIDPVLFEVGGVCLWWYGLSFALSFLAVHRWFGRNRLHLGLSTSQVYDISILLAIGVLLGARLVVVVFYEWPYYSEHPWHTVAYWLGGMATHGIMLGALTGTWVFCALHNKSFLRIVDELVIPAAFIMGVGRLGNFIDGQIVGSITDVSWGVKFPDAEGFRHPVVLYDGVKNLLLIPLLLVIRRTNPKPGIMTAIFLFWYSFLRIFVDVFRDYRVSVLGIGTGQGLNILMSLLGIGLFLWSWRRVTPSLPEAAVVTANPTPPDTAEPVSLWAKRGIFALLLLFSLMIPSDRPQDIPERYGKRHPGLRHSILYPQIEEKKPDNIPKAQPSDDS